MELYVANVYQLNGKYPAKFEGVASVEVREGHLFVYTNLDKTSQQIRLMAVFVPGNWIGAIINKPIDN